MLRNIRALAETLSEQPRKFFFLLWACLSILYLPAWKAGFAADFHGWLQLYYSHSFSGMLNREGNGIHSLYQVTQLQLYLLTALLGKHLLPWFFLFTALQALAASVLMYFCKKLFEDFGLKTAGITALLGAVLFAFHPSNTEVVVWKACYHYLAAMQIVLWSLVWLRKYLVSGEARWAWFSAILFAAATFTLEIFYAIPWLVLTMCIAYRKAGIADAARTGGAIKRFFLPQLVLFGLHLLLFRAVFGKGLSHGAYELTGKTTWKMMARHLWDLEFHGLLGGRLMPEKARSWVYHSFADSGVAVWGLVILIIAGLLAMLLRYNRWKPRLQLFSLLGVWSLFFLGIVLHFDIPDLFLVLNDRYLYFPLVFQCMMLALLIGALIPRRSLAFITLGGVIFGAYLAGTAYTMWQWRQQAKIFWAMQQKFRWNGAPAVVFLNVPSYYKGINIFPAEVPETFNEHLKIYAQDSIHGKAYDVVGYNMTGPGDGAHVTVLDSAHLKVTLNQWGTWWWYRSFGATDYENEMYKIQFTDPGHEYLLTLKQQIPGAVLLYQQGDNWRVVDMRKTGEEQW